MGCNCGAKATPNANRGMTPGRSVISVYWELTSPDGAVSEYGSSKEAYAARATLGGTIAIREKRNKTP